MFKQMKVQNIREMSLRKPDLETLYKKKQDTKDEVWEKFLVKTYAKR